MEKIKYLFIIFAVAVLGLSSCKKQNLDTSDSTTDGQECKHANMVFVPGSEPDETSIGWKEHYYCPDCGKFFTDAEGKHPTEDIIIWGSELNVSSPEFVDELNTLYYEYEDLLPEGSLEGDDDTIGKKILEQLKKLVMNGIGEVFKKMLSVFHSWGKEAPKPSTEELLKQILGQLRNIELAFNELSNTLTQLDEKNMMVDRERKVYYLYNATHPAFMAVLNELEGIDDESKITDEKKAKIRQIVEEWYAKGIYNGTVQEDCYITVSDLAHFFNGYIASKSFLSMYDGMIEKKSSPWVHEQEPVKYMIRIADVMMLTEGYAMIALYLNFNPDATSDQKLQALNSEFNAYYAAIDNHPVPHSKKGYLEWAWPDSRDNKMRLQHYYLYQEIYKFDEEKMEEKYNYLYENGWYWDNSGTLTNLWDACHQNHYDLCVEENYTIWKYYKDTYGIDSYYAALVKAGFTGIVPFESNGRLVCWDYANWEKSNTSAKGIIIKFRDLRVSGRERSIYFSNCVASKGWSLLTNDGDRYYYEELDWRNHIGFAQASKAGELPYICIGEQGNRTQNIFQAVTRNPSLPDRKTGL